MTIIIKKTQPLILARVGASAIPATNSFEDVCKKLKAVHCQRLPDVGSLLLLLSSVKSDSMPTNVSVGQKELDYSGISLVDFAGAIRVIEKVSTVKFLRPVKIQLTYRSLDTLSYQDLKKLEKTGIDGIMPHATRYGIDSVIEANQLFKKGIFCPDYLINDSKPEIFNFDQLTPRQLEVLHLIARRGLCNKQIARQLGIGESAVKVHVGLLLNKFGVRNRTELALVYTEAQPRLSSGTFKV